MLLKKKNQDELVKNSLLTGIQWQTERSYSEEEVLNILSEWTEASKEWGLVDKWFEQLKRNSYANY